jgi:dTDP-4-amino-4,6-dideoxygalactose transaminase
MIHTFSPTIRRKEMDAVLSCMVDEKIGPGDISKLFTDTAAELFAMEAAMALRSPLRALEFALNASRLEPGSSVMLSALAPAWQYDGVLRSGFQPQVLDVASDTVLVAPETVREGIAGGGRLLILQEALGQVSDYGAFQEMGIPVVQDATQSVGAKRNDESTLGALGYFTIIGLEEHDCITAGGGALVLGKSKRDGSVLRSIRESLPSVDALPDINNALALVQLKEFRRNEERRLDLREKYVAALMQGQHRTLGNSDSGVYSFPVLLERGFKEVQHYAAKKDIQVSLAFQDSIINCFDGIAASCPNARSISQRCALFPLYPLLSSPQVADILKVLSTLP